MNSTSPDTEGTASCPAPESAPLLPTGELDVLWFQVGGTLCNLSCTHCFISCSPTNRSLPLMHPEELEPALREAERLGVREYYLTGGEPFIAKDLEAIVARILRQGPVSVLTNGTLITEERARAFAAIRDATRYSLEFRVSLDGCTAADNDAIRGRGTFERALRGIERLVSAGFLPILTAAQVWDPSRDQEVLAGFVAELERRGYRRPRIKLLPRLKIGAEESRAGGYAPDERITADMMEGFDSSLLQCFSSRMVSSRGVHVCPILVDDPRGFLGGSLTDSLRPFPLAANACFTCWQYGSICSNVSSGGRLGQAT
ncbi:MAG: radical SAM protein [Planctomycetota bacterium]